MSDITKEGAIEQLENAIGIVKQNGKDYFDERDIPILEIAIESIKKIEQIEKIIDSQENNHSHLREEKGV